MYDNLEEEIYGRSYFNFVPVLPNHNFRPAYLVERADQTVI